MSVGLQQSSGFPVQAENHLFAYHVLSAVHDAAEEYLFMSGGRHVHESGIELFISGQIAQRLVGRQVYMTAPWGKETSNRLAERADRRFLVEHAILEAGGGVIFGEENDKRRMDIGLITTQGGEDRAPQEVFCVIEVKRHLGDIQRDVAKLHDILIFQEQKDWGVTAGVIVALTSAWDQTRDGPSVLLERRLKQFQADMPDLDLQGCWLERTNPLNMGRDGHPDDEEQVMRHPGSYRNLAAYCVFLKLRQADQ